MRASMASAFLLAVRLALPGFDLAAAASSAKGGQAALSVLPGDNAFLPPPAINARAAVVLDSATGTMLFGKNPDLVIPPASLTKLVTLHLVYEEIAAGRMSKDEIVVIDRRDCSPYIPMGSSLMYLAPGMKVTVMDLMRGAAVVSGNDAAFALARRIAGSNEAFALRMNQSVRKLGFKDMYFVEPSGLSELNRVTAREFARFSRRYMELHPESIAELHSLRYIEFPRQEHETADYKPKGRIIQYNRNNMVLGYEGCDGLKTGYIIEAGFNLAATAKRGGTRFLLVTLGGTGEGIAGGGAAQRSMDGSALLDWSFANFVTMEPPVGPIAPVRTWYGATKNLILAPAAPLAVTLPRSQYATLSVRVESPAWIDAPIAAGARLGEVIYSTEGKVVRRVDLVASSAVARGNIFVIIRDAFARFFHRLFSA